jgi:hypothetical protein
MALNPSRLDCVRKENVVAVREAPKESLTVSLRRVGDCLASINQDSPRILVWYLDSNEIRSISMSMAGYDDIS